MMRVLPLTSPVGFAPRPVWGPAAGDWAPRSASPASNSPPLLYTTCLLERFPGDWMWMMGLDLR